MKLINLTENSDVYTANVYFALGTWNAVGDVNTLIEQFIMVTICPPSRRKAHGSIQRKRPKVPGNMSGIHWLSKWASEKNDDAKSVPKGLTFNPFVVIKTKYP